MLEFDVKSRTLPLGDRKGQTVYYAYPRNQQKMTTKMVIDRIVRESSLSAGDVRNALTSLSSVVNDALAMGMSVDLSDLGSFRLTVPSKMMDTPEDVTVAKALKNPKITFTPKAAMREAANSVEMSIYRPKEKKAETDEGTTTTPDTGGGDGGATGGNPL